MVQLNPKKAIKMRNQNAKYKLIENTKNINYIKKTRKPLKQIQAKQGKIPSQPSVSELRLGSTKSKKERSMSNEALNVNLTRPSLFFALTTWPNPKTS